MKRTPHSALIVALGLVSACQGGVTSGPPGPESLQLGAADVSLCLPLPEDSDYVIGDAVARNTSDASISILGVELKDPQGVELVESWFVTTSPERDLVGVGDVDDYELPDGTAKIAVEGAEIAPDEELNLVLRVADTGDPGGSFEAASVTFRIGEGPEGVTDTLTSVEITRDVDACMERA